MKNIKKLFIALLILSAFTVDAQNVGINTTGAAPAATNLFEVLQTSTTASSVGIYSAHSGAISGTGYGIWIQKTGASTTNVAGYFSASGATNNYAIIVPSGGGRVGIGTNSPNSLLHIQQASDVYDAAITIGANAGNNSYIWRDASNQLRLDGNSTATSNVIVNGIAGGDFGIGTTSTSSSFHVNSNAANTTAIETIENTAGNYQTFISTATPNGSITGSIGDIVNDVTNGVLYYKKTGTTTNTGWQKFYPSSYIEDADSDTKIQTEESADEDKIRFDIAGTEHYVMERNASGVPRLEVLNSGRTIAIGNQAGAADDGTNNSNIFIGENSGVGIATGTSNIAIGENALNSAGATVSDNIAIGTDARGSATGGTKNIDIGTGASKNATGGTENIVIGYNANLHNVAGDNNVVIGMQAGLSVSGGGHTNSNNVLIGFQAGMDLESSLRNVIIGAEAGDAVTSGNNNVLLGYRAANNLTTGAKNIVIGHDIDAPVATTSNQLNIGNIIYGTDIDGTGTTLSSGNIGIGTSSPGSKLDVKGTMRLSGSTSGYVGFAPAAVAGSTTYTLPSADGTNGQVLSTNGSGALAWASSVPSNSAMFVQTNSVTVANTTTESTILGTGTGSLTIPANTLTVGKSIRLRVGAYGNYNSGFANIRLKFGTTTIASANLGFFMANLGGTFDIDITCLTTGATGTVIAQGFITTGNAAGISVITSTAATTIDTTVNQTLNITIQYSAAHANNTITTTNAIVQLIN